MQPPKVGFLASFDRGYLIGLLHECYNMQSRCREIAVVHKGDRDIQPLIDWDMLDSYRNIVLESIELLQGGASTIIFRGNVLKAWRRAATMLEALNAIVVAKSLDAHYSQNGH